MNVQAIFFSKDRALQLHGALQSFFKNCIEAEEISIRILYHTSNKHHQHQYDCLQREFPQVQYIRETHFRHQLLALIADAPWILFAVDDVLFYRPFSLHECITSMEMCPEVLSANLLLGKNTVYCYPQNASQEIPLLEPIPKSTMLRFRWDNAEYDFGYPLEISGSLYRASTIISLLQNIAFDNPNTLEAALSQHTNLVAHMPWRIIYPQSVGFCNPLNRVQQVYDNRVAAHSIDAETLSQYFDAGQRIDSDAYASLVPNAVHFEAPLHLRPTRIQIQPGNTPPSITAVIPVFNGAAFLPQAVASLVAQQYGPLEIIVVNDGSTDDSSAVAHRLARKYAHLPIHVIDKPNGGLADARNAGIARARGDWILPLDCDDCFAPGFLHQAADIIAKHPEINLIFSNVQEFGARNNVWNPSEYSWEEVLERNTFPYASLYRKDLWTMSQGYDPSIPWGAEDWNFWIQCTPLGIKPYRLRQCFFHYRIHAHGSMYTHMMAHWPEVVACMHTLHPHMYPVSRLLEDHQVIANMHPDTAKRIEEIIAKHPDRPMPYFWRGLRHEAAGQLPDALADYVRAANLAPYNQWQPYYRLYCVNTTLGRVIAARDAAEECVKRQPQWESLLGVTNVFCAQPTAP